MEYLNLKDVIDKTKISRSTIYRRLGSGRFPEPKRLGPKTLRWLKSDIEAWMVQESF